MGKPLGVVRALVLAFCLVGGWLGSGCAPDEPPVSVVEEPASPDSVDVLLPETSPAGMRFDELGMTGREPTREELRVSAYGNPDSDDPLAGPSLAAIYEDRYPSEDYLSPDETGAVFDAMVLWTCPGYSDTYEKVEVHEQSALRGWEGDTYWVCWDDRRSLDIADYDADAVDQLAVVGRGVSPEVVWEAAKAATVDEDNVVTIPDEALPADVEFIDNGWIGATGDSFTWTNERADSEIKLYLSTEADQTLLARAMSPAEPVTVRGRHGMLQVEGEYIRLFWQEGDLLVGVSSRNVSRTEIERFAASLVPSPDERIAELNHPSRK